MKKNLEKRYDEEGNEINLYKDEHDRDVVSEAIYQYTGIKCVSNPKLYGPDVLSASPHKLYEIRRFDELSGDIQQKGNRSTDIFGLGYNTINLEDRKFYMWDIHALLRPENDRRMLHNRDKGIEIDYAVINSDKNQIILVPDAVIRDPSKSELKRREYTSRTKYPEDFLCFKLEYCIILNLQLDGKWVDSRLPNGKYQPLTARGVLINKQNKQKQIA